MFTWFQRKSEFLGYEVRKTDSGVYELAVRQADGAERIEQFADQQSLTARQMELQRQLEQEGWTGPQ